MADDSGSRDVFAEAFRRWWSPAGVAMAAGMSAPTLDPSEVERRIAELRAIEGWLSMNLSTVRLTIQAMEVQASSLRAVKFPEAVQPDSRNKK